MPKQSNLRVGRVSLPEQIYHVTTVTLNRQPVFTDFQRARRLIRAIMGSDALGRTHTLAFVVMPDHLHWLVQLRGSASLGDVVGSVKTLSAAGQTWQANYHDHALRSDENTQDAARYIVANPVRAGLVQRLGDYPHWNAVWL